MQDLFLSVGLIVLAVVIYSAYKLRGVNIREYFKSKDGRGILRGIILGPLMVLVLGVGILTLSTCAEAEARWFNDAHVFAGIDYTKKVSPNCDSNTIDDRGTSNLGVKLNVWESASRKVRVNSKYTHHSCVLGKDDKQYDGVGVELEWKVWDRHTTK